MSRRQDSEAKVPGKKDPAERRQKAEWQTLTLVAAVTLAFGLVTWFHAEIPWWLLLPLGGIIVCLHGSLQHEVVHGHPTRWPWLNEALIFPNLWLWMPFRLYREDHISHHRNAYLTDPLEDPETYYQTPADWSVKGPAARALLLCRNTLLGRLLLGPPLAALVMARRGFRELSAGRNEDLVAWMLHGISVSLVLAWVLWVCGMPVLEYILFFAYPGTAITMLRSFLEHRAHEVEDKRTAVVEAGPFWSLMFLNNNLHALHHAAPQVPWYELPARYRANREAILARNGGYLFAGYWEVFRLYFLHAKEPTLHPYYHSPAFARLRIANDSGDVAQDEQVA